jgi:hypothetical protein
VEAHFGPFGGSANLEGRLGTVCAKRIVGSKITLDAPEVLLGDEARVKARFGLFGGSANLDTR